MLSESSGYGVRYCVVVWSCLHSLPRESCAHYRYHPNAQSQYTYSVRATVRVFDSNGWGVRE
jgi:hypothetical protein